jgi:hypothetical protein
VRSVSNIVIRDVSGGLLCYNGKVLHSFLTYNDNSNNSYYMYRERHAVGFPKNRNVFLISVPVEKFQKTVSEGQN